MCGSCHDIVSPAGVHLERTFAEWKDSVFSKLKGGTCNQCHMEVGREKGPAGAPNVKRDIHSHAFPAVDVALTPFPNIEEQKRLIRRDLDNTLLSAICVGEPFPTVEIFLENIGAGHNWPSGATQDRRAWVELIAYAGGQEILRSGVVNDDEPIDGLKDEKLWMIRDCVYDDQGKETHLFWKAHKKRTNQVPVSVTNDPADGRFYRSHLRKTYSMPGIPDRITMRVRLRPMGEHILDELYASGDLRDESVRKNLPTFDLGGTVLEWTRAKATHKYNSGMMPFYCVYSNQLFAAAGVPGTSHAECPPPPE